MKRAHEVKNTLQCCFGAGEPSQSLVLSEIRQQLEECRKSLSIYLQTKREVCSLYLVSLRVLSQKGWPYTLCTVERKLLDAVSMHALVFSQNMNVLTNTFLPILVRVLSWHLTMGHLLHAHMHMPYSVRYTSKNNGLY